MKISILKESLCLGGTERSAANISVALAKHHEVTMVLFDGSETMYPYGGRLYDMKLCSKTSVLAKALNNLKRIYLYRTLLREEKPDVVFLFISFRNPISSMRLRKCVKLVSARDFSVLSSNIEGFKKDLDASDGMICNSQYLRDYYLSMHPEDKERVFTVHNIIDTELIARQAAVRIDDDDFLRFQEGHSQTIVSVGRFCKEKAFEHLLNAFAQCRRSLPGIGLVLVGDGEYKEKYLKIIAENDMAKDVYLAGYQKNPYQYMKQCNAFVLSSLNEGFPNVLAEAMALSLPVVSINCYSGPAEILMRDYDYECVKEAFAETDFGILAPHYSVKGEEFAIGELAKAIVHLLQSKALMEKYANLSIERARDFSDTAAVKRLEQIFAKLHRQKK